MKGDKHIQKRDLMVARPKQFLSSSMVSGTQAQKYKNTKKQ